MVIDYVARRPNVRTYTHVNKLFLNKKPEYFKFWSKHQRGRNINGTKILRNAKNFKKNFFIKTNKTCLNFSTLFFINKFILNKKKKPFLALCQNKWGATSIFTAAHNTNYFSKYRVVALAFRQQSLRFAHVFIFLIWIKKNDMLINLISYTGRFYALATAAGTFLRVLYISFCKTFVMLQLPSKKQVKISIKSFAFIGRNSNMLHKKEIYGSAHASLFFGKEPAVRGVAMNPVDHPHGGRTKTNQPEVSPWGWITKKRH